MSITGSFDTDVKMLLYLDDLSLINISMVDKYYNTLYNNDDIWNEKIINLYRNEDIIYPWNLHKYKRNKTYKEIYLKLKDKNSYERLRVICKKGYLPIFKQELNIFLRNNGEIDKIMKLATTNGHLEIVKHTVDKGASILSKEYISYSFDPAGDFFYYSKPLTLAAKHGHIDIIMYFEEKGIDSRSYYDAIERSVQNHPKVAKYLLESLYNIEDDIDEDSIKSILEIAVRFKHFDIVKYLLDKGIDIHFNDDELFTIAIHTKNWILLKYLVSKISD